MSRPPAFKPYPPGLVLLIVLIGLIVVAGGILQIARMPRSPAVGLDMDFDRCRVWHDVKGSELMVTCPARYSGQRT